MIGQGGVVESVFLFQSRDKGFWACLAQTFRVTVSITNSNNHLLLHYF